MPVPQPDAKRPDTRMSGLGRVLITVYLVLALAATLRAVYQLITKYQEAPLAYVLSLVSGLVYIVATVALMQSARSRALKSAGSGQAEQGRERAARSWRTVAWIALIFELTGVLVVGTLSITHPELFDHPSVWSWYGNGYLFIPLVLPVLGMIWLRAESRHPEPARRTDSSEGPH